MNDIQQLETRIQELLKEREEQDIYIAKLEIELAQVKGQNSVLLNNSAQGKAKYERALNDLKYYKAIESRDFDERWQLKFESVNRELERYREKLSTILDLLHQADRVARN